MIQEMQRRNKGTRDIFMMILSEFKPLSDAEIPLPENYKERVLLLVLEIP